MLAKRHLIRLGLAVALLATMLTPVRAADISPELRAVARLLMPRRLSSWFGHPTRLADPPAPRQSRRHEQNVRNTRRDQIRAGRLDAASGLADRRRIRRGTSGQLRRLPDVPQQCGGTRATRHLSLDRLEAATAGPHPRRDDRSRWDRAQIRLHGGERCLQHATRAQATENPRRLSHPSSRASWRRHAWPRASTRSARRTCGARSVPSLTRQRCRIRWRASSGAQIWSASRLESSLPWSWLATAALNRSWPKARRLAYSRLPADAATIGFFYFLVPKQHCQPQCRHSLYRVYDDRRGAEILLGLMER